MPRLPLLRLLLLLLASSAPALTAAGPLVRLDIVDRDRGQWLPVHPSRGESWIAGTPGHRYGVRLTNTSGERVLVVLSVDGVNAVTGETAHPGQTGYVLAPWQSAEIDGWRKSYQDVAAFVFTALEDSYAARTDRAGNVGTIGVAVFRERAWPPAASGPSPPIARGEERIASRRRQSPAAAEAAQAHSDSSAGYDAHSRQQIGTGHGRREWSPVGQTPFMRASRQPVQVSQLRYDAPHVLAARGIIPRGWADGAAGPQAFPGTFVQDPPGRWR